MNVVIGPNGAGKSTIVSALCLGLGGSPNDLKRGNAIGSFVRSGEQSGYTEIFMYRQGQLIVIKRTYDLGNHSEMFLNNQKRTFKEMKEFISNLGIDVQNILQFLPQERVNEFSEMSDQERLVLTLKATGSRELVNDYAEILELKKKMKDVTSTTQQKKKLFDNLKEEFEKSEREIQAYEQQRISIEKLEKLMKKRPWLEWSEKTKLKNQLKEYLTELQTRNNITKQEMLQYVQLKGAWENKYEFLQTEKKKCEMEIEKSNGNVLKRHDKIKDINSKYMEIENEISGIRHEESLRIDKLNEEKEKLAKMTNELSNMGNPSEIKQQYSEMNRKRIDQRDQSDKIQEEKKNFQRVFQTKINQLENLKKSLRKSEEWKTKRLENLKRYSMDHYRAYQYLQSIRSTLKDDVFGPCVLDIKVKDPKFSALVEAAIQKNYLIAMICRNENDRRRLVNDFRRQGFRGVTVLFDNNDKMYPNPVQVNELHKYGVSNYVDQIIDAPPKMKTCLVNIAGLQNQVIGNQNSQQSYKELYNRFNIFKIFTIDRVYQTNKSKYGRKEMTVSTRSIYPSRFLTASEKEDSKTEIQDSINRLTAEIKEIEQKIRKKDDEIKRLQNIRIEYEKKVEKVGYEVTLINTLSRKIKNIQEVVKTLEKPKDIEKEIRNLAKKKKNLDDQKRSIFSELAKIHPPELLINHKQNLLSIRDSLFERQIKRNEIRIRELDELLQDHRKEVDEVEKKFLELKLECKSLKAKAAKELPEEEANQQIYRDLPSTLSEIDEEIIKLEQQTRNSNFTTESIDRFNKLKVRIETEQLEIARFESNVQKYESSFENKMSKWLPEVKEIVSKLDEKFGGMISKIRCAGSVSLTIPDDRFEPYGIKLDVSFRKETSDRALSSSTHSGGEKSLTTMLYLIAMQGLSRSPFWLVDEINQGLDPDNEQIIWNMLTEESKVAGPQYFIITPKLGHKMTFAPTMTPIIVFNGYFWDIENFSFDAYAKKNKRRRLD